MSKIMLVEDDKSLREIYGVRLLAEGYEIISAGDGEEALAMAVKEKPVLILSDVMMPKISGFDMLDILRSTPETKDIKVIMMTALSSEDQRTRGETLGANKYLVKSQVGIEDVVRTVHEVLADAPIATAPAVQRFGNPAKSASVINLPVSVPPRPTVKPPTPAAPKPVSTPAPTPQPATTPAAPATSTVAPPANTVTNPTISTIPPPTTATTAPAPTTASAQLPQPTAPFSTAAPASLGERVISPINPTAPAQDMASLMEKELQESSEPNPPTTK